MIMILRKSYKKGILKNIKTMALIHHNVMKSSVR